MHVTPESPLDASSSSPHVAEPRDGNTALLPARYPLLRPKQGRLISGVCRGVALHLGMRTWVVRLIALALIPFFGAGFVAYVLLTISVRAGDPLRQNSIDDAVQNQPLAKGNAPQQPSSKRSIESNEGLLRILERTSLPRIILGSGVLLLSFGLLLGVGGLPVNVIVPVLLTACGMGISWLHIDDAGSSADDRDGSVTNDSSLLTRLIISIGLIVAALVIYAFSTYSFMQSAQLVFVAVLLLTGVGVAIVPWANSMVEKLSAEHALKEREEERADMTAHLHDGVLQTLALIQLHATEPSVVSTLAHSQEESLREWLYHHRTPAERSVSTGIRNIAAEIELEQGKTIDVVAVSDAQPSECSEALLDATRQALLNAAMHGAEPISVYSEAHDNVMEVFVRDHGDGFDMHEIPHDRLGIRESIVGRMERKGGSVDIVSRPGWGTEVRMRMPLEATNEAVNEAQNGSTGGNDGNSKGTGTHEANREGGNSN
ncbi:PspC domain-containing protein [Bifidobacterium aquikefiricola]|uniref:PspC domain-containing protein n=1 Tax=Bifidobacterium aquikefiricola TaxID=3059038 RepID=A0AB39U5F0_9BIFI